MTRFNGRWFPVGTADRWARNRVAIGDVVAYDFRAWEVTHLRVDDFGEDEEQVATRYRPDARERMRPYSVSLRRLHGPVHPRENSRQEIALRVRAFAIGGFERYDEGRVPLCSCCGHPWPCRMVEAKKDAEDQARVMDERMSRVGVGVCYGCGEPITRRQESITYPEGNVDFPGYPPPRFHTRKKCAGARWSYDKRRAALYPDKPEVTSDESAKGMF